MFVLTAMCIDCQSVPEVHEEYWICLECVREAPSASSIAHARSLTDVLAVLPQVLSVCYLGNYLS